MTAPTGTPGPPGPVWTTAAVARRLGIAPATLRSWSQRYGIGPAAHTPGSHRRYTAADLAELDAIRGLVADGVPLPAAAALVRAQRHPAAPVTPAPGSLRPYPDRDEPATGPPPRGGTDPLPRPTGRAVPAVDAVAQLASAAFGLDPTTATHLVAAALTDHGVLTTWEQLCLPAFDVIDASVTADLGCVDAHLLLSWVLAACLRQVPTAPGPHPVLLACTPTEQHSLGLDALTAALAERRIPARMLGATASVAATLHACARLRPRAVVIWSQRPATAEPDLLRQLRDHTSTVLAAGPGWHPTALPAATTRTEHLRAALALITATESTTTP